MNSIFSVMRIALIAMVAVSCAEVRAQTATPPAGYFDIPPGFDFPADKQTLEQFRKTSNVAAQRKHVWNIFAGMTQPTPDNKHAIFETWFADAEVFQAGAAPQAVGPRRIVRRFSVPQQLVGVPGQLVPQAAGDAILSEVMFNFANFNHIRTKKLNSLAELQNLLDNGPPDTQFPNNKTIPAFPAEAISLKTVWWPVRKDKPTPMPIWDPEDNPLINAGNPYSTWKRVVAVDPTRTNIPPNETMTIDFLGRSRPNSHVVGLDKFHFLVVDAQMATNAMANVRLRNFVTDVFGAGRLLQEGDIVVFAGTHLTTKEIDDWVWATFWWHDRPDAGPFAADRTANVTGKWQNYLMSAAFDVNLPLESDGKPRITYNPWLEAHFRQGIVSNCMNCHHRAAGPNPGFLPIFRGNPDPNDPAFAPGMLRTDFLWTIIDKAN